MIRAKFKCHLKDAVNKTVYLAPVTSGSEENENFFKYTPYGTIVLNQLEQSAFDAYIEGTEYYVDFSPSL